MAESDISVAILYPGNRLDKMAIPLMATDLDVEVKPKRPYTKDIVLLDNADRNMVFPIMRKHISNAKVVYRMRGDVYRELETWDMPGYKKWIATDVLLPNLDGAIAVNQPLAEKLRERAGLHPVGEAGLAVEPDDWPDAEHELEDIRAITLTNANYERKITPILAWAPVVERFLAEHGGEWVVGGDGTFDYMLTHGLREYDHVTYGGYIDAEAELARSNLCLHPSNLDGLPNGILEPMACGIPVITNDFVAFTSYNGPLQIASSDHELRELLHAATGPSWRGDVGQRCLDYVLDHHNPREVGKDYARYFMRLLREDGT